jgi:predicted ATPase
MLCTLFPKVENVLLMLNPQSLPLLGLEYRRPASSNDDLFPFSIPIIRNLDKLTFASPITFLVGENGSGKSTLLEAIAMAAKSVTVGTDDAHADTTLTHLRELAGRFRLIWSKRSKRGFFLRSEDFFGYAKRINQTQESMLAELDEIDAAFADRSEFARGLARSAHMREIHALQSRYGDGLDAGSHGENFLKLFRTRFVPNGLYLLDEPEAPLSPMRQLSLLAMLKTMIDQSSQFIIATHSPILMAYPGATILSCDRDRLSTVAYEDLEHVNVMRDFLANPSIFLRHLLNDADNNLDEFNNQ